MAFDQPTRNRLAAFASEARTLLSEEFTRQLQADYGLDPQRGDVTPLEAMQIDSARGATARLLRETLAYYLPAGSSPTAKARQEALERIVREQAFTVLNRLCALRMAEARGLLIESVGAGYQSKGFQLYNRLAGGALGETGDAYRAYLFSIFDEFAVDLPVLYDRYSAEGRLFPREGALLRLLAAINHPDLAPLWGEDETIGWIYQYFNSQEERRRMRAESQAPRNSRELAVRNQFFTPRYVVEFLTDNTLGRTWYEMAMGRTALAERCRYLVRRPNEVFLAPGEAAPPDLQEVAPGHLLEVTQEELLRQPVFIPYRAIKDPRTILLLDPACGSMHFGLYAFDLFETIYAEAWEWEEAYGPDALQRPAGLPSLHGAYADKAALLADVPRLIVEQNIHGIDIDPRAVQIAGLSLWLRAQRSWHEQGLRPADRPVIRRSNIVCAEPMPGDRAALAEFVGGLEPKLLGELVTAVFDKMELAGEAGSLLKIEEEIRAAVEAAQARYEEHLLQVQREAGYLPGLAPERDATLVDLMALPAPEQFWATAEELVVKALREYAAGASNGHSYRRRLFAHDAEQGFAFIDVCRKRYDVVLMNPPFGGAVQSTIGMMDEAYSAGKWDLAAAFGMRSINFANPTGLIGILSTRIPLFTISFDVWRRQVFLAMAKLLVMADLGGSVLDDAMVETACYCIQCAGTPSLSLPSVFMPIYQVGLEALTCDALWIIKDVASFQSIPGFPFAYWLPKEILELFSRLESFEPRFGQVSQGLGTTDDFRFCRLRTEVPISNLCLYKPSSELRSKESRCWVPYVKGDRFSPYYDDYSLTVNWADDGKEVKEYNRERYGSASRNVKSEALYGLPGLVFPRRTRRFAPRYYPSGMIFSVGGQSIIPNKNHFAVLGFGNTALANALVQSMLGRVDMDPQYEVGVIKRLPFPTFDSTTLQQLEVLTQEAIAAIYLTLCLDESSAYFVSLFINPTPSTLTDFSSDVQKSLSGLRGDLVRCHVKIEECVLSFLDLRVNPEEQNQNVADIIRKEVFEIETTEVVERVISYTIGMCLGRWNIHDSGLTLQPHNSHNSLPISPQSCPPGMLQNAAGLPATPADVPAGYPLRISWPGILPSDPGHAEDVVTRVREALRVIWPDSYDAVEQEACGLLGVPSLAEYFNNPNRFFADHLGRYSKSRRAAPLYWPLSTPSGAYTLWLYYHRLTDQTLYQCVNDFVDPKRKEVGEQLDALRRKTGRSRDEERALEQLAALEGELAELRAELLRVAAFWKPDLNDGVQITAAPLYRLFNHRPWRKRLQETWAALEAGEYDWAHLAYAIWPARVAEKCRTDKSLAIAHNLEHLYVDPPARPGAAKTGAAKEGGGRRGKGKPAEARAAGAHASGADGDPAVREGDAAQAALELGDVD